ncbi:MAG: SDR family oxidoreductase [Chitinophagaceae bacterium]
MKILLTGSNGMVGSNLSKLLSGSRHTTLATGRNDCRLPPTFLHDQFKYQSLDIRKKEDVIDVTQTFCPDLIIHCAAMTQVDDCEHNKTISYSTNVDATDHLIEAAEEVNARFCYLSTDFVFSGEDGPYTENNHTAPVNYYGMTKELAEQHLMSSKVSWTIIRTILLYGKADQLNRTNFIYWVKKNLEEGKHINVVADQVRTPTYVPDLTDAIIRSIEIGAQGLYHISGKDFMSPFQMALAVARKLNLDEALIHPVDASSFTQAGRRPLKTGFIIDKAIKELNYTPKSFAEALDLIF